MAFDDDAQVVDFTIKKYTEDMERVELELEEILYI
nr:hypothetical protein [Clostridium baratii]